MRTSRLPLFPLILLTGAACATAAPKADAAKTEAPKAEAAAPAAAADEAPVWSSAERFTAFCDAQIAKIAAARATIVDPKTPATVDGILRPYDDAYAAIDRAEGWASLTFNVHPDPAVREAGQKCEERVEKVANDLSLDRKVYDAIAGVDVLGADPLTQRFVKKVLLDFRRSGVDQDQATREKLAKLYEEMVKVGQTFMKNVTEDVRHITVDGKDALKGLPQDYVDAHQPDADGKIEITTDYPDFFPFETYAERADLREALYEAYLQRGYPQNEALLKQLLTLRHDYAALLGYPSWAEYMAADKMVKDGKTIRTFLERIETLVRPRMESDLKALLAAKRKVDPDAKHVQVWDRFYWTSKVREEKYGFDARTVRPYFSFPKVKQGILDLYSQLFDVTFVRLPDAPTWAPDVEAWSLRDHGKEVGRFFFDMHPREGKYKHAAAYSIQTGETGRMPMASLVCNFPDPKVGDGSALMEHDDVRTFFHEFGHLIHFLLGRNSEWVRLNGFNVEWDFVEAPSQLLEEWTWSPKVLQRFAVNAEGQPIPTALVEKLKAAHDFGKGIDTMRQIFYAAYSFYLHSADMKSLDLDKETDALYARYNPFPRPENSHVYTSFGHLVGYTSMYYTYQWSLAIAKDLFSRFEQAGLLDPTVAAAYKKDVLMKGGTEDADRMIHDFLGRDRSLDAYQKWLEE